MTQLVNRDGPKTLSDSLDICSTIRSCPLKVTALCSYKWCIVSSPTRNLTCSTCFTETTWKFVYIIKMKIYIYMNMFDSMQRFFKRQHFNRSILYKHANVVSWAATWENQRYAYAKTKRQITCAVTPQLISVFVFAIGIVWYLYFLQPKFPASYNLL